LVQELHPALTATGRFQVKDCLGSGGFGVVFEVYDSAVNARVALKWLRNSDASTLARFKREFRSLADLVHPNLVGFRELITVAGEWFFTMDLVEGVDLLHYVRPTTPSSASTYSQASTSLAAEPESTHTIRINASPLAAPSKPAIARAEVSLEGHRPLCAADLRRVRTTFEQLASGLGALHAAGMIHRDIKPSNVLVGRDGRVVILDLGLVTEIGEDGISLTRTGNVVGTPAYMSPEQARGDESTPSSDWYSVGIILYQALTGRVPFDNNPTTFLLRKQTEEPISPTEIVRGVPKALSELCMDLLSRAPERRPMGAAFLERLRQALPLDRPASEVEKKLAPSSRSNPPFGFVGRETHVWALEEALDEAERGKTVVCFVHGSSGMGKSALVRHFLDGVKRERPEILVLEGRCYERESVPYKAVDSLVDSLCRYLQRLPEVEAAKLLPRDLTALARLFPVFNEVETGDRRSRSPRIDAVEERRRAFEALRELLARITDRSPVILFIDDLQWGDGDSEPLLLALFRAPDPPPILLVAAYRTEDAAAAPLVRGLRGMAASSAHVEACEIPTGELSPEAAFELASTLLAGRGDAALASALAKESCGSPLFLRQLAALRHTAQHIDLATALRQRVDALSAEARRLLETLAVSGRPIALAVAARAAGIEEDPQGVLAQLRAETLVRTRGVDAQAEVEIYHDRIREVVVGTLDEEKLRTRHKKLARALAATGDADAEALATHYSFGGERDLAAEYAEKAADRAAEALAFARAAEMYEMALGLQSKDAESSDALVTKLAEALVNAGRGREAAERFLQAALTASPADALELRRRAAEQLLFSGHIDEGLRLMDRILATMKMRAPTTPLGAVFDLLWLRFLLFVRGFGFKERTVDAIARDHLVRIDMCFSLGWGLLIVDPIRGAAFQARYLLLALAAGEPLRIAKGLALEAAYRGAGGARAAKAIERLLQKATSLADRVGQPHTRALMTLMNGVSRFMLGEPAKAVTLLDRAHTEFREKCTGVAWELDNATVFAGFSLVTSGCLRELAGRLPAQLEDARTRGDLYGETLLRLQCTWIVKLAANDVAGARAEIAAVPDEWSGGRFLLQNVWQLINGVDVELYAGRPDEAWKLLEAAWPDVKRSRLLMTTTTRVRALNARARAAMAAAWRARDTDDKRRFVDEASRMARALARESWPLAKGYAVLIDASVAAIHGDRKRTIDLLRRAIDELGPAATSLYSISARLRLGQILDDDEGRELVEAATAALTEQRIADPAKMSRVFVPFSSIAGTEERSYSSASGTRHEPRSGERSKQGS
jgi:serine/threonine protein kinase